MHRGWVGRVRDVSIGLLVGKIFGRILISLALCVAAALVVEVAAINYYVIPKAETEFIAKFDVDTIEEVARKPFMAEFHLFTDSDLQPDCIVCLTETALGRVRVAFFVDDSSPGVRDIYWIVPKCDGIADCSRHEKYGLHLVPETQDTLFTMMAGYSNYSKCEYSYTLFYQVQLCTSNRSYLNKIENLSYTMSVDIPHLLLLFYPGGPASVTPIRSVHVYYIPATCDVVGRDGKIVASDEGGCS